MSRLKEIISRTLIQNVMESNFVEFESWANLSEASFFIIIIFIINQQMFSNFYIFIKNYKIYSSTEENVKTIKECLNVINIETQHTNKNVNDLIDLENQLAIHPNFSCFLEPISFSNFKQYLFNANLFNESEKCAETMDKTVVELCKALIHPETIELITKKFLENLKK